MEKKEAAPKKPRKKRVGKFTGTKAQEKQILKCIDYGLTVPQTADVCGINPHTLEMWSRDPELARKMRTARERADMEVYEGLRKSAKGHKMTLKKSMVVSQGKDMPSEVVKVENEYYYPPDSRATMFWLCNRQPTKFKMKQEIDINQEIKNMSDKELEEAVTGMIEDGTLKKVDHEDND